MSEWDADLARRIGEAVKDLRTARGWTAARLSDETTRLGYPVHRVAIGKLENGHRGAKFDVAELIVLAEALGVPPVRLLFPNLPDGDVEYLPGETWSAWRAYTWFTGQVIDGERTGVDSREYPYDLMRERSLNATDLERARRRIDQSESEIYSLTDELEYAVPPERSALEAKLADAQKRKAHNTRELEKARSWREMTDDNLRRQGFTIGVGEHDDEA